MSEGSGQGVGPKLKLLFAISLLGAQLVAIVYARFTPLRYFCWAPNDYVTDYTLTVTVNQRKLTDREILKRYRLPEPLGIYENPVEHITAEIQQYETTYGRQDNAAVELSSSLNGKGATRRWAWPPARN
jgi:hypothetical protein